jgi:hypothetical protein
LEFLGPPLILLPRRSKVVRLVLRLLVRPHESGDYKRNQKAKRKVSKTGGMKRKRTQQKAAELDNVKKKS